jgi:hypothetical protein
VGHKREASDSVSTIFFFEDLQCKASTMCPRSAGLSLWNPCEGGVLGSHHMACTTCRGRALAVTIQAVHSLCMPFQCCQLTGKGMPTVATGGPLHRRQRVAWRHTSHPVCEGRWALTHIMLLCTHTHNARMHSCGASKGGTCRGRPVCPEADQCAQRHHGPPSGHFHFMRSQGRHKRPDLTADKFPTHHAPPMQGITKARIRRHVQCAWCSGRQTFRALHE